MPAYVETQKSTGFATLALSKKNVTNISDVYNSSDNISVTEYYTDGFGKDFLEFVQNPFDKVYDNSYSLIESDNGEYFAFYNSSNDFDLYSTRGGYINKVNSDAFIFRNNVQDVFIVHDYLIVWYSDLSNSYFDLYLIQNNSLEAKKFIMSEAYPNGLPLIAQLKVVYGLNNGIKFCYTLETLGVGYYITTQRLSNNNLLFADSIIVSSQEQVKYIIPVNCLGDNESYFYCYCTETTRNMAVRTLEDSFSERLTDAQSLNMIRYPDTWFSTGSDIAARPNREDKLWLANVIRSGNPGVITATDSQTLYMSRCGKYAVDFNSSEVHIQYIVSSSNGDVITLAPVSFSGFTIENVIIFNELILFKIQESPYYTYLPIPDAYTRIILPLSNKNKNIQVTYNYNLTFEEVYKSLRDNISAAYDALEALGATMPSNKNAQNLVTTINSLSS